MNAGKILLQPTRLSGVERVSGTFGPPDGFYGEHWQRFCRLHGWIYRHIILHWMNARVRVVRSGSFLPNAAEAKAVHRCEELLRAT